MPQSLTKLYVHLIFSTKNRERFLDDEIRERVHGYLATVIRSIDSPYVVVGGASPNEDVSGGVPQIPRTLQHRV